MSKIFGAVRFGFGIFRWIFVHFFHFIRFDLYCYKIAPRSFQLPAYLWRTLLDLERIGGLGKRQSRAELCNQVIGIHTFFIWPYLSCTQINRAIESLRHVIRIWTPFLAVPFFHSFGFFVDVVYSYVPFSDAFIPLTFPQQLTHFVANPPTPTPTHTFTYASSSFRFWLERTFRSIIMENLHHNNGFSIRRAIFLLSSKGQQTENMTHDYHSHWNSIWNKWTHGTIEKNGLLRLSFSVLWLPFERRRIAEPFFCLHRLNLYVIVCQRIFSKTMICFLELWALAS